MNIVILGASGGCGRLLVEQSVARGDSVVAVGRSSSTIEARDGVKVQRGDLGDPLFLAQCFAGADVVISALGHRLAGLAPWHQPQDPAFIDRATKATLQACRQAGVGRVMAISAGGVGPSWAGMPAVFKLFVRGSALKNVYPSLARMEEVLLASGLDVCIPRPSGLTDEPAAGGVRIVTTYKGRAAISRADVASWMLGEAHKPSFEHRTPLITVTGA